MTKTAVSKMDAPQSDGTLSDKYITNIFRAKQGDESL